jgi:alkyl hydroperoxide reductase subunit AhpF
MLNEDVRGKVRQRLEGMEQAVKLLYFTREADCTFCGDTRELVEDLAGLSDKLTLEIHDFAAEPETAAQYGITRVPAIAVVSDRDRGVRIYGIPAGYEFAVLLEAILDASRLHSDLNPETVAAVRGFTAPVHLEVFVTPT